jgi:hypothetical protein
VFVDSPHPYISFWLDVVDKAVKVVAVLLGGGWTLMLYRRNRTFRRRLEPGVSGQLYRAGGAAYLVITCTLKNVGSAKCDLNFPGTWCEVQQMKPAGREVLRRFAIFRDHPWIESGEPVTDSVVLPVPPPETFVALHMTLKVKSQDRQEKNSIVWKARNVLPSADAVPAVAAAQPAPAARKSVVGVLRGLLTGGCDGD